MPVPMVRIVVRFQGQGFRWPLRDGDTVELWSARGPTEKVGELPGYLVAALIAHFAAGVALTQDGLQRVTPPRVEAPPVSLPAPPRPLAPRLRGVNGRRLRAGKEVIMRTLTLASALALTACAFGGPVVLPPPTGVPASAWTQCEDEAKATAMLNRARGKAYLVGGWVGLGLARAEPAPPGPFQPQNPQEADTYLWTWHDCARKAGYPVDPGPEPGALKRTF